MCGRMTLTRSGSEIAHYFSEAMRGFRPDARTLVAGAIREENGDALRTRYNVAPSQDLLTVVVASPAGASGGITGESGGVAGFEFAWKRWGLVPAWAKDPAIGARLFNARLETADSKPSFRAAWKRRRCLVVADGFYEWTPRERDHRPYHFRPSARTRARDGDEAGLLAFAGLYEHWLGEGGEVIDSCTVLTTEANADLANVHHRMPVIVPPAHFADWLGLASACGTERPATDPNRLKALVGPAPAGTLERRAVSRYVNDPRHDDPRCLAEERESGQVDLFDDVNRGKPA